MSDEVSQTAKLVALPGGWPEHFDASARQHGESLLAVLRRARVLDEAVFGIVVRYAAHRSAYDKLSAEIAKDALADDAFQATATSYLSGKEQSRAFHENKLLTLERELLATPYVRAKSGVSVQTDFMDQLDAAPIVDGGAGKVTPFRPMARKTRS